MIKRLSKSIREYKKESILTMLFIILEVIMEVLIPLLMAYLIDKGIDAANINVVYKSSLLLFKVGFVDSLF